MLLMSLTEAARAIGAKCGGAQVSEDDQELAQVLAYITPRVEAALNVSSLTRGYYRDRFVLPAMPTIKSSNGLPAEAKLRLSNGFLQPESLTLYGPDGEAINEKYLDIDFNYGVVNVSNWEYGVQFAEYISGFEVPEPPASPPDGYDPNMRVLVGVPDAIKGIVAHLVVLWYRIGRMNPKAPKDVSYTSIMNNLGHELRTRIYGYYQRPRANHYFGEART